jgi:hypothetical protein
MLHMNLGVGIAIGVTAFVLILVIWAAAGRKGRRDEGARPAPSAPIRNLSDDEFWGLYWQRRLGIRRETKTVRGKSTSVILFGQIPISPMHSRWVYDLERGMLASGLIIQPRGTNWLLTEEGKRALEGRLGRNEKPERPLKPLVNAETLQNIRLEAASS